ncbi:phenolic glucoside malonyltransferase 1-like [Lotus japonicus]|uniref:phenolic glucoside malonyltransferase 1-like n=1 Tax=Lotus japonicus TaxID=34305 RepID=UPI00258B6465|nr:phenolic glucoside malonyltransferase 1-like [Lotus japonicus]
MASPSNSIKIHENCLIAPPPSSTHFSLPLTFFDMFWLRFHPVERIFFYSLPLPHSQPSFFFDQVVPKLKTSLSFTLQHFLPLAGSIVWPSESDIPIIQFNPGDGVSLVLAECDDDEDDDVAEFNQMLKHNSPREATESRKFVPDLESSDSRASVFSLQITLFRNRGFCIGISTHHAVLDGKSSTMFIKAWALTCKTREDTPSLAPELEPFFDREVIKDPSGLGSVFVNSWKEISSKLDPSGNSNERSLKIMSNSNPSQEIAEGKARATFELTREDIEKIKKRVLSMWHKVEEGAQEKTQPIIDSSKPNTLSTFVVTCAYVSVCIAKAIQESERDKDKVHKFLFGFTMDCRTQLKPPIPENYFGNCVSSHIVDNTDSEDFTKEDGVVIVAKSIHKKIKMLHHRGPLDGVETLMVRFMSFVSEGVVSIGVAGSNRFGVYGTDFGWGRPKKVEITSIDRNLTIGMAESKDGKGGVEVGLVLDKHVMGLFGTFFLAGLCSD